MSPDRNATATEPRLTGPSAAPELDASVAVWGDRPRTPAAKKDETGVSASVIVGTDHSGDYESLFAAWKARPTPVTAEEMLAAVADIYAATDAAGLPRPGRPTIQAFTGATEHRVRCALQTTTTPPAPAPARRSDRPRATSDRPPRHRRRQDTTNTGRTPTINSGGSVTTTAAAPAASGHPPAATTSGEPDHQPKPPAPTPAGDALAANGARLVAWTGFVFGSLMSVAANVLATWLPGPVLADAHAANNATEHAPGASGPRGVSIAGGVHGAGSGITIGAATGDHLTLSPPPPAAGGPGLPRVADPEHGPTASAPHPAHPDTTPSDPAPPIKSDPGTRIHGGLTAADNGTAVGAVHGGLHLHPPPPRPLPV